MGLLVSFISAFFWAFFDLARKISLKKIDPYNFLIVFSFFQILLFFNWTIFSEFKFNFLNYSIPGIILVLINILSGVLFLKSLKLSDLSLTIPLLSFTPLFSTIFSAIILDESLNFFQYFGIFLIIFGAMVLYSKSMKLRDIFFSLKILTQGNRNPLLYKNLGSDGIKTGYLAVEKYSLASTIKRNNRRLVAVGSGFQSKSSRSKESTKLLTYGLTNYDTIMLFEKNIGIAEIDVWQGVEKKIEVFINEDIYKTIPKARKKYLKALINYNGPVVAPISKGQVVGTLKIYYKDELIKEHDLLAVKDMKRLNIFSRIISSINYLIWGNV